MPKGVTHLEVEQAIYVPSTKDVDKPITKTEFNRRVSQVRTYMRKNFSGSTSVQATGNYTHKGKPVNERVVRVVNYADTSNYRKKRPELMRQIKRWGKRWGQHSMGYEVETDMYYIPTRQQKTKERKRYMRRKRPAFGFAENVMKKL